MRYEIRFYDALDRVKVAIELDAPDRTGAETAARHYLWRECATRLDTGHLVLGAVRELS